MTVPSELAPAPAAALRPDADVVDLLESIFRDHRLRQGARPAEVDLDRALWRQLDQLGLTRLTGPEQRGGAGASWWEAAALLGLAAGAGAAVPLAEHDVLGGWLLEAAGLDEGTGLRTVAVPDAAGTASCVPWARSVDSIVALWPTGAGGRVAPVPIERVDVTERRNLAGEPADGVRFNLADLRSGCEVPPAVAEQYRLRWALARCAQIAGAMSRITDVVLDHVNQRSQFGRPIGRFQAVQALVADLAAEAALARSATDAAVAQAVMCGWEAAGLPFTVAVAASTVGHAATVVVRNAHQAVGAIGATLEHELPSLTKPILFRRGEVRSVRDWDAMVAGFAGDAGPDGLWALLTTAPYR